MRLLALPRGRAATAAVADPTVMADAAAATTARMLLLRHTAASAVVVLRLLLLCHAVADLTA
eukprot:8681644-Alexandrium_andersonii.AAC.1